MTHALGITLLVFAAAFGTAVWFASRAAAADARRQVYELFAQTFDRLRTVELAPKERRKAQSQRQWLRLTLQDPLVRDGLRAALAAADEYWDTDPADRPEHDQEDPPRHPRRSHLTRRGQKGEVPRGTDPRPGSPVRGRRHRPRAADRQDLQLDPPRAARP